MMDGVHIGGRLRMKDAINQPKHYTHGSIECIDVIKDWKLGYHLGNTLKYICRSEYKSNKVEDLPKAAWYLEDYMKDLIVSSCNQEDDGDVSEHLKREKERHVS